MKIYQRICEGDCSNGEVIEERCEVPVDGNFPRKFVQFKEQDGYNAHTCISRLEKVISCTCRCFVYRAWYGTKISSKRVD